MQASGTVVEWSDSSDNYRVEALGAIAGLLVPKAATQRKFPYSIETCYCDNKGIIGHCNDTFANLHENQS